MKNLAAADWSGPDWFLKARGMVAVGISEES
jgi:hypothetical protein